MDFNIAIDDEMTEYERLRQKNIQEIEAMMTEFSEDLTDSIATLNKYEQALHQPNKKKKRVVNSTFALLEKFPFERRRSDRLANITPCYSYTDLDDEEDFVPYRKKYSNNVDDIEKVVFRRRASFPKKSTVAPYVAVTDITVEYLKNIAMRVVDKTYSSKTGTSCHQCRQKTLDSKTYCRSGNCIGVRGQFCGVCLKNRYGEDAKEALLDPKWKCPPCRDLCNCSICRTRKGKRPTGILAPLAFQYGHKSVKDFLLSLSGKYDYVDESVKEKRKGLPNSNKIADRKVITDKNQFLLGFNKDLKPLWVVRGKAISDDEGELVGFERGKDPVMIKL
ncbi:hypothetical protein Trydic_g16496 [Trypoxylus dichotomus]